MSDYDYDALQEEYSPARQVKDYATALAISIHAKHFPEVTQWEPLPDTLGLLTQIDNMVSGLVRPRQASDFPDDHAAVAAERERCAHQVRHAARLHGLCCADCDALAEVIERGG